MYPDETQTPERAEDIKELLEQAKAVQAKAREDYEHEQAFPATEQEEREWIEQQVMAAGGQYNEYWNGQPEVEKDDDEMPGVA